MKVLLIHNSYQHYGGEDAAALAEKRLLEERGNEVISYTRHNDEIKNYGLLDKITFFPETVYSLRTRREITSVVTTSRPDVAYLHNIYPLVSPSVYHTLYALGVPIVQVLHDSRPLCVNSICYTHGEICERCKNGNYLNAVRYRCFRDSYTLSALYAASLGLNRVAGVLKKINFICLTEFTRLKLLEVGVPADRLFIRPNFVDTAPVSHLPSTGNYAVYLGRLPLEKGGWTLVRAFEAPNMPLLKILGTGPEEATLKDYVRQRQITNIEFVGFKSGEEKWELLRNSLFMVVPSEFYEICPITILEAYAAGKPVIAADIGGVPYVVENGKSGMLFRSGSVTDLAAKVRYLIERPAEIDAMGRYGRHLAETMYGPDQAYKSLMGIFDKVSRSSAESRSHCISIQSEA
jgi:glycosyltransferase involved in cell wall biosynthesis